MCLPKKCCFFHSLKQGIDAIVVYDGIMVGCYSILAFALTLAIHIF